MKNTFGYHVAMIVIAIALAFALVGCSSHDHSFVNMVRQVDSQALVKGKSDERIETYGALYCEMYYSNDTVSMLDVMDAVSSLGLEWDQWLVIEEAAEESGLCDATV